MAERKSLKRIFGRGGITSDVKKETRKLCASYVGGIWERVSEQDLIIKVQSGGMNNFIFIVSLPEVFLNVAPGPSVVILRIYFSEDMNDSLTESIISAVLAEKKLGPFLYGAFLGGRIEEYIPSRILTNKELCNIHVGYEIGRILAAVHSLEVPIAKDDRFMRLTENMVERLKTVPRWSQQHKMHTTLAKYREGLYPEEITLDLIKEELELAKRCLACSGSPLVFSNNDIHEGNLLLRDGVEVTDAGLVGLPDAADPIVLIDYEYASYYYRGFDFCHYCCECCLDNTNPNWPGYHFMEDQWPNEEHQRRFAEGYLEKAEQITKNNGGKRPKCVSDLPLDRDAAVHHLLMEIRQFAAFPQLMWAIWSFRQAEDFPIDPKKYDFFEYGFDRLALYYKWKPEMLKYLNEQQGKNRSTSSEV